MLGRKIGGSVASKITAPPQPIPTPTFSAKKAKKLPTIVPVKRNKLRNLLAGVAGVGVVAAVAKWWDPQDVTVNAVVRVCRDVRVAASCVADYKWSLRGLDEKSEEYQHLNGLFHQRCADKLRDLCLENGGTYIKLGQHLSQLQHLLPDVYVNAMLVTLDKAPTSSYDDVRNVVKEELGAFPEDLFDHFDPIPLASASLAQVHHAITKDGKQVAVKVQHRWLKETVPADLKAVEFLVDTIHNYIPAFNYRWLVDEMNKNLPLELDFAHEGANSERCAKNFKHRKDVTIPGVHWDLTSSRVLSMDFVPGCQISDVGSLRYLGLEPHKVSTVLSEIYSQMIFIDGFIHCDPHPGNVLVQRADGRYPDSRPMSASKPNVVLLDHGLYREIDDEFRLNYSHLWQSIIFADIEGIKKYSSRMNVNELFPLFAGMLTHKEWKDVANPSLDHLQKKNAAKENESIRGYAMTYGAEISQILAAVPSQLLLLLKTNDTLRNLEMRLESPSNTFFIMARYCLRAINEDRLKNKPGWRTRWANMLDWLRLEFRLFFFHLSVWADSMFSFF